MRTRAWRLVSAGIVVAFAVGLSGRLVERIRLGADAAETLAGVAAETASGRDVIRAALLDPQEKGLFARVAAALPPERAGRVGVTVYDAAGRPAAWAGRASDLPSPLS